MILANIPFINAAPFFHYLDREWLARHNMVRDSPRDLGRLAREGKVDAGLLSLVDLWELEESGQWESLGNLGVAGEGDIQSILLFGVQDPTALEGKSLAVSGQTSTSVKLLDLWLRDALKIKHWNMVDLGETSDGALLIADQALARSLSTGPQDLPPIDLCRQWTQWTGLPFVFARWAVRKELPQSEKKDLLEAIEASLQLAEAKPRALAQDLAAASGFPADFLDRYLSGIRYRLGEREEKGMALFKSKLKALEPR